VKVVKSSEKGQPRLSAISAAQQIRDAGTLKRVKAKRWHSGRARGTRRAKRPGKLAAPPLAVGKKAQ
jgi:hypothetical protein